MVCRCRTTAPSVYVVVILLILSPDSFRCAENSVQHPAPCKRTCPARLLASDQCAITLNQLPNAVLNTALATCCLQRHNLPIGTTILLFCKHSHAIRYVRIDVMNCRRSPSVRPKLPLAPGLLISYSIALHAQLLPLWLSFDMFAKA